MTQILQAAYRSNEFIQILRKNDICNDSLLIKPVFKFLLNKIKDDDFHNKIETKKENFILNDDVKRKINVIENNNWIKKVDKIAEQKPNQEKENQETVKSNVRKKRLPRNERRGTILHK